MRSRRILERCHPPEGVEGRGGICRGLAHLRGCLARLLMFGVQVHLVEERLRHGLRRHGGREMRLVRTGLLPRRGDLPHP